MRKIGKMLISNCTLSCYKMEVSSRRIKLRQRVLSLADNISFCHKNESDGVRAYVARAPNDSAQRGWGDVVSLPSLPTSPLVSQVSQWADVCA
jgi:hypothetical protein